MKPDDYLIITTFLISLVAASAAAAPALYFLKVAKGRRLFAITALISLGWWSLALPVLFSLFLLETETSLIPYKGEPFWFLTVLRMATVIFATTGVNAGVLSLFKFCLKPPEFPPVWRASFITSLAICLTAFGIGFLINFLAGSYFIEPQEFHCYA